MCQRYSGTSPRTQTIPWCIVHTSYVRLTKSNIKNLRQPFSNGSILNKLAYRISMSKGVASLAGGSGHTSPSCQDADSSRTWQRGRVNPNRLLTWRSQRGTDSDGKQETCAAADCWDEINLHWTRSKVGAVKPRLIPGKSVKAVTRQIGVQC